MRRPDGRIAGVQTPTSFVLYGREGAVPDASSIQMKKSAGFILILSIILSISGCETYEYNYYGSVTGIVTDTETNSPISNASVLLMPGSMACQTQIDGVFVFSDLEEGQYTISVTKDGYQSNRKTLNVISGEDINTSIQMRITNKY